MNNRKRNIIVHHAHPVRTAVVLPVMLLIALAAGGGCDKEEQAGGKDTEYAVEKKFERGPLTVHVRVEKETLSIADTLRVQLEAAIEEKYEVTMPAVREFLQKEQRFGVLDFEEVPDRLGEENRMIRQREYRLEPLLSGKFTIPELKFVFQEKKADTETGPEEQDQADTESDEPPDREKQFELLTEEIPVEVTSLLDEQRAELTIEDIKTVARLTPPRSTWWIWALGGAGVVSAGAVIVILLLRRRKDKPLRILKAAHEIAYDRLRKLAAEELIEKGEIKEFYERISNILRWYIEHRFALRAPERTTEEFLIELKATDLLDAGQKQMLQEFLTHCDMVKFALYGPTKSEIQKAFDLTKQFIEATKITEKQVDVTEQVQRRLTEVARSA